ncbi:rhodanese-like domain-containing protein [Terrisporobacter petrolearius]|uniref:rhodanese-like domain-containing protein n=1 Tax=Terrisporobacter petrolearius TaxID=1460447 RepID=UPI0031CC4007
MKIYEDISSLELNNMIKNKEKLILLDVRTDAEYNTSRIPNAINIPISNLDLQIDLLLPYKDEKVIIYCRSGKRSVYAAHLLDEYGFKHLFNLTQGIIGYLNYL